MRKSGLHDVGRLTLLGVVCAQEEVSILERNERAMRQRQLLAEQGAGDEQGEIIKLLQAELRDMQLQLRAAASRSRDETLELHELRGEGAAGSPKAVAREAAARKALPGRRPPPKPEAEGSAGVEPAAEQPPEPEPEPEAEPEAAGERDAVPPPPLAAIE